MGDNLEKSATRARGEDLLFIGIRMLCDLLTRGYGDHSPLTSLGKPWMLCYVGARVEFDEDAKVGRC